MEWENVSETFEDVVSEMSTDPAGLVPISSDVLQRVTEGDADPRFATFIIESGWSKSNRFWGAELFNDVASEMNAAAQTEPLVGYMGHIRPDDDPYSFPEIQLQWVGAKMLPSTKGGARLAVKAYALPGTKGREYLQRGIVKTVSWRGKIAQEIFEKGVRVKKFAIESIDLSRPRAAGLSARLVGSLSSEMETETGGNEVKPEEIAALAENELRAHNPQLAKAIEDEARKPVETQVSEMKTEAAAVAPVVAEIPNLRKVLGLDENADDITVLKAAMTFVTNQGKTIRDTLLAKVMKDKKLDGDDVSSKMARRAIVGEMTDFVPTGNETNDLKLVSEMVNTVIDSSDELKEIVSEMEDAPASPTNTGGDRSGKQRELKDGFQSSTIRVRSVSR